MAKEPHFERRCPRCGRVCFSPDEFHSHDCFDMDAKLDAAIAEAAEKALGRIPHPIVLPPDASGHPITLPPAHPILLPGRPIEITPAEPEAHKPKPKEEPKLEVFLDQNRKRKINLPKEEPGE